MPARARGLSPADATGIAELASHALSLAPFGSERIVAGSPRESLLRSYLAAFGITGLPRLAPRSPEVDGQLLERIGQLLRGRRRATLIYVVSPVPSQERWQALEPGLSRLPRHRARCVRWLHPPRNLGLPAFTDASGRAARTAAAIREHADRQRGERALRRLGILLETCALARPAEEPAPVVPR
jgi:hypothetical protein